MEERLNAVFDLFAKWGHENYIGASSYFIVT